MSKEPDQNEFKYESPFAELLEMRRRSSADGVGVATMTVQDKHRQDAGVVQGGIIVTLADYAFHLAVESILQPGQSSVTIELKVNFIAPAIDGELTATSKVVSAGRRVVVCDVDVTGQDGSLIAKGMGTYLIRSRPS